MHRILYRQLRRSLNLLEESIQSAETEPVGRLARVAVRRQREFVKFRRAIPDADLALFNVFQISLHFRTISSESTLPMILRKAFEFEMPVNEKHFSLAFTVLRWAEKRVAVVSSPDWKPKPTRVKFDIGQVFRHKKHGFRGVIIEWWPECPADEDWSDKWGPFEHGREQPFYRTLVDTKDRPNPFMTLAAQENLIPLHNEKEPVEHPYVAQIFKSFEAGRHTMQPDIVELFPEDE